MSTIRQYCRIIAIKGEFMSIRNKIKSILADEDKTMKSLAEDLSLKKNKKISADVLSKKLIRDAIKYYEVEEILDLLGYKIKIEKK